MAAHGATPFVNDAVGKITGYRADELQGKNWWDVFYPGGLRRQVDDLYLCFRSGDVSDHKLSDLRGDIVQRRNYSAMS